MKSSKKIIFVIILISSMVLLYQFLPNKVVNVGRSALQIVASPFEKIAYSVSSKTRNFFSSFAEIGNLRQENNRLKEDVYNLMVEKSKLQDVQSENQLLKKEIEVRDPAQNFHLMLARVIGREPNTFLKTFLVDQGEDSGVKVGQAVVSSGILVGKITLVTKNTAEITLVISNHSIVQAMLSESRTLGIVKGGNLGLYLDSIPQDVAFKSGELVVTSGLGGDLPRGIIIGQTNKVTTSGSEIFQAFSLTTPLDFNKLESVFIVKQ